MALPQSTFDLPTKGLLGGPDKVTVRSWTAAEEKVLYSSSKDASNRILDTCIVEPKGFSSDDLVLADKNYIFYMLRVVSLGSDYDVEYTCPYCGTRNQMSVNLMEQPVHYLDKDFEEPFPVVLPNAGVTLGMRLLRGKDSKEIAFKARQKKKRDKKYIGDPAFIYKILYHIVEIDGDEPESFIELEKFVENLSARDLEQIRIVLADIQVGLDDLVFGICSACGEDNEFRMPFNATFFRPSLSRGGAGEASDLNI